MLENTNELVRARLEKLTRLKEKGIDPYPKRYDRTHTTEQAVRLFKNRESENETESSPDRLRVAGRIISFRGMGNATFMDLLDGFGRLQILFRRNTIKENYDILNDLDIGDWIGVEGPIFRTRTREITLEVIEFEVLCKSLRPLPEKWHGLKDVELRYRQKYLDLISNPDAKKTAVMRSLIIKSIRNFMDDRGFIEVETPTLVPVAAGAMAHPFVTHHNALNRNLYLRIATELYLKRLIVGGIEKVYEIGKVFRNEGVDLRHNPEFTTMESYESFIDYNDVMQMVEELVHSVSLNVRHSGSVTFTGEEIDFSPPWPRLHLRDQVKKYSGIDFFDYPDVDSLREAMNLVGVNVTNQLSWGGLLDKLISDKVEPNLVQPCFLIDYPVAMSPLAKRKDNDPRLVERFEGFIAKMEICNAFTELNDPIDQRERFEQQEQLRETFEGEETDRLDEDFLVAIEHGMPPTGGLGIGIDRLTMLLTDNHSIREVVLFPQLRNN